MAKFYKFTVKGIVQGVGFRPHIYNMAKKHNIKGYILNHGSYVIIISSKKREMENILSKPPEMAKIEEINITPINLKNINGFEIRQSLKASGTSEKEDLEEIPPDYAVCEECLKEMKDKNNRRYLYPFITCTNCGPRYSITQKTPFDRKNTSMKEFKMCKECKKEYSDPTNRRYYAQTISCKKCGPKLTLYKNKTKTEKDVVKETIKLIKNNKIVAIKGIGGFHLVCTTNEKTVKELRKITNRPKKPYALMFKNLKSMEKYVYLNKKDKEVLESPEHPILILKKKNPKELKHISELDSLGCMLPYTPLHHLIFEEIDEPLIFTSSNISGEPITYKKEQQITPYILDNNREIINPIDDSVLKSINNNHIIIRRARGYTPKIFRTKNINKSILAVGGDNNNTIALYHKGKILVSEHIGNLENYNTYKKFKRKIKEYISKTKIDYLLADLNPEYISTKHAEELSSKHKIPLIKIQHHLAHAYSIALEQNLKNFISIVFDGSGYGTDKKIWGGEIFKNKKRIGHLEEQPLLGGEKAIKEPGLMALGILAKTENEKILKEIFKEKYKKEYLNLKSLKTTSCGRILDAVSFLLGFSSYRHYQGRPAMLLESNTPDLNIEEFKKTEYYLKPQIKNNSLMTTPLIEFILEKSENRQKKNKEMLAYTSQIYIAEGLLKIAEKNNKNNYKIIFSGGCSYNRTINKYLSEKGAITNQFYPSGDGGLSFGQIGYFLLNYRHALFY